METIEIYLGMWLFLSIIVFIQVGALCDIEPKLTIGNIILGILMLPLTVIILIIFMVINLVTKILDSKFMSQVNKILNTEIKIKKKERN